VSDKEQVFSDIHEYRRIAEEDPVRYANVCLGLSPWPKQADILRAAADPSIPYICWRSGNGVGKTYLTAAIICQYLDTHYPGLVAVSSSNWSQLMKTVWPKLKTIVRDAPVDLGGEMMAAEWRRDPNGEWGAFCVSPACAEGFSGFRTENGVLVIVDEASALGYEVHEAIMGLTSARGSKVIYLGNPLHPEGPFHDAFQNPDWAQFHTASTEVTKYNIPGLATEEWVRTRKNEWGEDHPIYKARVLGEFPDSTSDSLVKLVWLDRVIIPSILKTRGDRFMGVDVARYGDDRTAYVVRDERSVLHVETFDKTSTVEVAGHTNRLAKKFKIQEEHVYVDDTGVGGGVTDMLHNNGFYVSPVNVGEAALDRDQFRNLRAELYWQIRNAFSGQGGAERLLIPNKYKDLAMECTWAHYKLDERGRIQLERKQDIKKRKGRSPDLSDALALTYYEAGGGYGFEAA
jgi:hypothetical protein